VIDKGRVHLLKTGIEHKGPVIYWMSRDQRAIDNWALLFAIEQANGLKVPLHVVFSIAPSFLGANIRHYTFMFEGLREVEIILKQLKIGFHLMMGEPEETIPQLINELDSSMLISDFDPLKIKRSWKDAVNKSIKIPHLEVDAHNIVPCRLVSQKIEFGAYTLRPKIKNLLSQLLVEIPEIPSIKVKAYSTPTSWEAAMNWINADSSVATIEWLTPGSEAGLEMLKNFINEGLTGYSINRNNPVLDGQSNLSPYLHFGQIAAQRVAMEVAKANAPMEDKSAFLEELIVRRELSDNFCFYNSNYDNIDGFHAWAKETINKHRADEREHLYSQSEFEEAKTHDLLWNAAELEMVKTGKMHGYMRMYWAKKILEWTKSPEEAMSIAIYLNDKYSLDGRDPNGYAGIAWSIGGVHDRTWSERPIFGKIRYMNYNGCKRKFNVNSYIDMVKNLK
jgi:deoxyribodipyrimidine photo-lyase